MSAGVPAELDKIIARCLRKDPERRAQSIADIKLVPGRTADTYAFTRESVQRNLYRIPVP